jgi:hypothetical protein
MRTGLPPFEAERGQRRTCVLSSKGLGRDHWQKLLNQEDAQLYIEALRVQPDLFAAYSLALGASRNADVPNFNGDDSWRGRCRHPDMR